MKTFLSILAVCIFGFCSNGYASDGHDAGYEWASDNGIDDPDECRSSQPGRWKDNNINNSEDFTEGCLQFLRDEEIIDDSDELKSDEDE